MEFTCNKKARQWRADSMIRCKSINRASAPQGSGRAKGNGLSSLQQRRSGVAFNTSRAMGPRRSRNYRVLSAMRGLLLSRLLEESQTRERQTWLNVQQTYDLRRAAEKDADVLARIATLKVA
jgi:hypothetical protein